MSHLENVFDYFTTKLGLNPTDATLANLSCASPSGSDCTGMIDWTAECIAHAEDRQWPSQTRKAQAIAELIEACNVSCEVYWRG